MENFFLQVVLRNVWTSFCVPPFGVFRCGIMIEDQRSGLCSFPWSGAVHGHHTASCGAEKVPIFFLFFLYFDKSFIMYTRVVTDSRSPCLSLLSHRIIGVHHHTSLDGIFLPKGIFFLKCPAVVHPSLCLIINSHPRLCHFCLNYSCDWRCLLHPISAAPHSCAFCSFSLSLKSWSPWKVISTSHPLDSSRVGNTQFLRGTGKWTRSNSQSWLRPDFCICIARLALVFLLVTL